MRKLKLQVQMSIDGFMAGPNGEMDWMNHEWSQDLKDFVIELTKPVDTILLGRKLAEGFIPYWTESFNSSNPAEGSEIFVKTPKIVFTKTLTQSKWDNTILTKGDLNSEVKKLKNLAGGDLIAYGGGQFVASLIREKLFDELNLFINPTAIGSGMPIFQSVTENQNYQLINCMATECGVAVMTYKLL